MVFDLSIVGVCHQPLLSQYSFTHAIAHSSPEIDRTGSGLSGGQELQGQLLLC